jgi:hypothetical protein
MISEKYISEYFTKGNYGAVTSILRLEHPYNMIIGIVVFCIINWLILSTKIVN